VRQTMECLARSLSPEVENLGERSCRSEEDKPLHHKYLCALIDLTAESDRVRVRTDRS
jgi:hypothetical protein